MARGSRRGEAVAAKSNRTKKNSQSKPAPARKPGVRRKKLKVAIAGFGTVGRSVAKLLCQEANDTFELTHIFNRDVARKKVDWVPASVRWTESINEVLSSDVDIFVELAGGVKPAGDWIRKALRAGKSVVTANKHLIAESGPELIELAREAGRRLEFGASVAGGIPAIMGIQEGLAGDRLFKIAGVLNGTCNFILTKMEATGASFESALKEAQELGFAEADPTNDVEGYDARAKLVILAQAGLRVRVRSEQIPCWPISSVGAVDFAYARELGCTIRQISLAKKETEDGLSVRAFVRPALVPASSLVAHVEGSKNLVMATGQYAGQMVFSGFGAGGDPTAVAVVSDLYSIARSGAAPSGSASGNRDAERRERGIHRALLFALRGQGPARELSRRSQPSCRVTESASTPFCSGRDIRIPRCRSSSRWKPRAAPCWAAPCRKSTGSISTWSRCFACRSWWISVSTGTFACAGF